MKREIGLKQIEKLLSDYNDKGGTTFQLDEGCLGYGTILLYSYDETLKVFIIQEFYKNPWLSGHTVQTFSKLPKKYSGMLEKAEELYY